MTSSPKPFDLASDCGIRQNFASSEHHAGQLLQPIRPGATAVKVSYYTLDFMSKYTRQRVILTLYKDGFRQEARPHREEAYVQYPDGIVFAIYSPLVLGTPSLSLRHERLDCPMQK